MHRCTAGRRAADLVLPPALLPLLLASPPRPLPLADLPLSLPPQLMVTVWISRGKVWGRKGGGQPARCRHLATPLPTA
jgi:hypothetical protein